MLLSSKNINNSFQLDEYEHSIRSPSASDDEIFKREGEEETRILIAKHITQLSNRIQLARPLEMLNLHAIVSVFKT